MAWARADTLVAAAVTLGAAAGIAGALALFRVPPAGHDAAAPAAPPPASQPTAAALRAVRPLPVMRVIDPIPDPGRTVPLADPPAPAPDAPPRTEGTAPPAAAAATIPPEAPPVPPPSGAAPDPGPGPDLRAAPPRAAAAVPPQPAASVVVDPDASPSVVAMLMPAEPPPPPPDDGTGPPVDSVLLRTAPLRVEEMLGDPDLVRRDGPAEYWLYRGGGCVLGLFVYPEARGGREAWRVVHAEARARGAGPPRPQDRMDPDDCLAELLADRGGPT